MIRILLTIIVVFFISAHTVSAQETVASSSGGVDTFADDIANYPMPYPGILPDNPLYPLKILRDSFVGFLISDPLKRIDFHILLADKRLGAGIVLYQKGKGALAYKTLSEGEDMFAKAIDDLRIAKKQGMNVTDKARSIYISGLKHQQLLQTLQKDKKDDKEKIGDLLQKSYELSHEVNGFIHK